MSNWPECPWVFTEEDCARDYVVSHYRSLVVRTLREFGIDREPCIPGDPNPDLVLGAEVVLETTLERFLADRRFEIDPSLLGPVVASLDAVWCSQGGIRGIYSVGFLTWRVATTSILLEAHNWSVSDPGNAHLVDKPHRCRPLTEVHERFPRYLASIVGTMDIPLRAHISKFLKGKR